jgi:hypothetical protein
MQINYKIRYLLLFAFTLHFKCCCFICMEQTTVKKSFNCRLLFIGFFSNSAADDKVK